MFPPNVARGPVDVMVTLWNEDSRADALALAGEFRREGIRAEVYPDADKLGKQFKYASSRHIPLVAVVGDDERRDGTVAIKDMRSGGQETVARAGVSKYVSTRRF